MENKEPSERELVCDILIAASKGVFLTRAVTDVCDKYVYLEKKKRSFIKREASGIYEKRIFLDAVIGKVSNTPVKKLKPVILAVLRMGIYELFFMDRIPSHATIDEAVKLVKRKGLKNLSGYVNAVLRNADRSRGDIMGELSESRETKYSLPEWILKLWDESYGEDVTNAMCEALLKPAKCAVRTSTSNLTSDELLEHFEKEGVKATPIEGTRSGFFIEGFDHLSALDSFNQGLFYVQDKASQMVVELAQIEKGNVILDVCAAPGGKAIHAAEKAGDRGCVIACDISRDKLDHIIENAERMQVYNIDARLWDAREHDEDFDAEMDVVIADLPCSGLGVLRKKPDIRYRVKPEDIDELAALQQQILDNIASYVKPGGKLVFSTCTVNKKENDGNVTAFLEKHADFELVKQEQLFITEDNDGFFMALFKKKNS